MYYYLLTFLFCFIIELDPRFRKNKIMRTLLTLWLYGFLCFGYMVGSDWRSYELDFQQPYYSLENFKTTLYPGYYIFCDLFKYISEDFFVLRGFLNIVYLNSIFYVTRKIFGKINFIAIVFFSQFLFFMLIGGPLKFLCASIFIMYATGALLDDKIKKWLLISFTSIFFHFSAGFILVFIFIVWKFRHKIVLVKNGFWFVSYFIILILTSEISFFDLLFNGFSNLALPEAVLNKILGYRIENVNNLFSLGSLKGSVFFLIVLFNKNKIINFSRHGLFIFAAAISYSIIFRILFIIPIGFRITMYSSIFFYISLLIIFYQSFQNLNLISLLKRSMIVSLITIPAILNIWQDYDYLPYSNSLQYITIRDHLPYYYRSNYNYIESQKRTGKNYIDEKE
jgi:hypothetical protein